MSNPKEHPFSMAFNGGMNASVIPLPDILEDAWRAKPIDSEGFRYIQTASQFIYKPNLLIQSPGVFISRPVYWKSGPKKGALYDGFNDLEQAVVDAGAVPVYGIDLDAYDKWGAALQSEQTHVRHALCPILLCDARHEQVGVGQTVETNLMKNRGGSWGLVVNPDDYKAHFDYMSGHNKNPSKAAYPYTGWMDMGPRNILTIEMIPQWIWEQKNRMQLVPEVLMNRVLDESVNAMRNDYLLRIAHQDKSFYILMNEILSRLPQAVLSLLNFK